MCEMAFELRIFCLQDFTPETGRYDVIWIQWCIGQLTDDDFIAFFKRAKVRKYTVIFALADIIGEESSVSLIILNLCAFDFPSFGVEHIFINRTTHFFVGDS